MSRSPIELELELSRMVTPWLEETMAIRKFCNDSGLPLPAVMRPLFIEATNGAQQPKDTHPVSVARGSRGPYKERAHDRKITPKRFEFTLPPMPNYGPRPAGAGPDWKAVPLYSASTANLILYIIKLHGGAAPSNVINVKLPIIRPITASSTAAMTLYALKEEGKIKGDFREWVLTQDVSIAMEGTRMWCGVDQLRQSDRAGLRREVILDALKINSGMSVAAISELLRQCEWLRGVACEPDMVKGDMRILDRDGFVKKEGSFWKLV